MSEVPDTPPPEPPPKPSRRWIPLAVGAGVVGVIIVIIAALSGGDEDSAGDTALSVAESVSADGSASTIDTLTLPATTVASSTALSSTDGPTTTSTSSAASSPVATGAPTSSVGATTPGDATTPPPGGATPIDLGSATDFALLGNTAVSSTGPSVVTGQVGASNGRPAGFSPGGTPSGIIIVDSETARQAQVAVDGAVAQLDGLPPTDLPASELGAQTIVPGTYRAANLGVSGTVTLDGGGDPNAVFVFESPGTLTIGDGSQITLKGGARACNVFWRLGSSASLGSDSAFVGTLIADDSIAAASGSTVDGRLIARNGAVTVNTSSIVVSSCA